MTRSVADDLERCKHVSLFLLEQANAWLGDYDDGHDVGEGADRMLVRELIDILSDHPGDLEVELAVIAPVEEDSDDITVDRYPVDGVLPWEDDDADLSAEESRVIWLIGGEEDDVEAFLDAVEEPDE